MLSHIQFTTFNKKLDDILSPIIPYRHIISLHAGFLIFLLDRKSSKFLFYLVFLLFFFLLSIFFANGPAQET